MICEECEYLRGERAGMWIDEGAHRRIAERAGAVERCAEHPVPPVVAVWMIDLGEFDRMPFGKYKGKPMFSVPVGYLNWIWNEGGHLTPETKEVPRYISIRLRALKEEDESLKWR